MFKCHERISPFVNNNEYFTKYLRKCKADGLGSNSIFLTNHIIKHFVEWCNETGKRLENFSEDDVYDFLDYQDSYTFTHKGIKKQYSEVTKQRNKVQVRKFLKFVNPELADVIKVKKIKDHMHPEGILSKEEIEKMINVCQNERDRVFVAIAYESGARKSELLALRLKHVNFDEHGAVINITEGKTGSRRVRLVYSSSFLHQWLDCHPLKENRDAFLFCSLRKPFNKISTTGLFDQLREIAGRAKIPLDKVYVHNFRHSRATHLSEHLTEAQLKEYLGWTKSSTMTSIYTHLSGRDIDKTILKMNKIDIDDPIVDPLSVGRCPRCKELNPETSLYCGKCGLPLTSENVETMENDKADFNMEIMKAALADPKILEMIAKAIKEGSAKSSTGNKL
jgi:integrase/recombinase XerD